MPSDAESTAPGAERRAGWRPQVPPSRPRQFPTASNFPGIPSLGVMAAGLLFAIGSPAACQNVAEDLIRKAIAEGARQVELPAGVLELTREIVIPASVSQLQIAGSPQGTTLRLADGFRGKAAIFVQGARGVKLSGFSVDGNQAKLAKPIGVPPPGVAFLGFYSANGVAADGARDLTLENIRFREMPAFAVLVARSRRVNMERLTVEHSGSRDGANRNNTTGGILLEEGTWGFSVNDSDFLYVSGNGVWTHSNSGSERNADGSIQRNHFDDIGRDAILVGSASRVVVAGNTGVRIGYPFDAVDAEGGARPAGIATAGNVDRSTYAGNRFEELNGECIELDGFHHGEVLGNSCVNRGGAGDYPNGYYGIVFGNSNPDVESREVRVAGNVVTGAKFGGILVLGEAHVITNNQLTHLDQAGCSGAPSQPGCLYNREEPDIFSAGIYLGGDAGHAARHNLVRGNIVSGAGMSGRCVMAAPGVSLKENTVEENQCLEEAPAGGGGSL